MMNQSIITKRNDPNTLAAPFVATSAEREATTEPATSAAPAARPPSEQHKLCRSSVGKILILLNG